MMELLLKGRCACREWPLLAGVKVGKCGYCGQHCIIEGVWEEDDGPTAE